MNCNNSKKKTEKSTKTTQYLNHNDTVKYVGINTCKQCHGNIYETFIKTGMGKSFDVASHQKSSAVFGKQAVIYDKFKDLYYQSFWQGDSMFIKEFRLQKKDTIYKRIEKVNYIIGSGQHTNSHLCIRNGYLTQMPMTFYTQKQQWDFPPGFENGNNTRFSRNIGLECMSCHNSLPNFVLGSENKFTELPNGIGCERCHGPGEAHVKEKQKGTIIDTSKHIDYSIVNPSKLSIDLQFDVCQRCHLQGNSVLKNNHSFYDFKPGLKLSDYISVFLPKYKNADDEFIMASHADRLKQSKCFIKTFDAAKSSKELRPYKNGLTCVSCHNPHVSVKETNNLTFNTTCRKCHGANENKNCGLALEKRKIVANNCVGCHMPKSGSIDIPHVTVHDHWIRKPISVTQKKAIKVFVGLLSVNEKNPDANTKAEAYLNYYEKFSKKNHYLDSAASYLNFTNTSDVIKNINLIGKYYFLSSNYKALLSLANRVGVENLTSKILIRKSFENKDAWTLYYFGEAYFSVNDNNHAQVFFKKAIALAPYNPDFMNKLAACLQKQNKNKEALGLYTKIVLEHPLYAKALSNLGYMYLLEGNTKLAEYYINKALNIEPDNEQSLVNKANLLIQQNNLGAAIAILKKISVLYPTNQQVKSVLPLLIKRQKPG